MSDSVGDTTSLGLNLHRHCVSVPVRSYALTVAHVPIQTPLFKNLGTLDDLSDEWLGDQGHECAVVTNDNGNN
jgi:hypothetical protein